MSRLLWLLAGCLFLAGCGITAPSRDAGFADVQPPDWRHTDQTASLSLGPALLSLAAIFVEDDPQTRQVLRQLQGVRVKVYEVKPGKAEAVNLQLDDMRRSLLDQAWEPVMRVQEGIENTHMLVKMDGEQIRGITVLNSDGIEAVFVNIMGDLQPEMFDRTVAALNVRAPAAEVARNQPY